jgi:hypothetical protein
MSQRVMRLAMLVCMALVGTAVGGSTIDAANRYAYAGNAGWLDWRADGADGVAIDQYYCTGYLWSANCGWIGLGNGPTNGWLEAGPGLLGPPPSSPMKAQLTGVTATTRFYRVKAVVPLTP